MGIEYIASKNGGTGCINNSAVSHEIVIQKQRAIGNIVMLAKDIS